MRWLVRASVWQEMGRGFFVWNVARIDSSWDEEHGDHRTHPHSAPTLSKLVYGVLSARHWSLTGKKLQLFKRQMAPVWTLLPENRLAVATVLKERWIASLKQRQRDTCRIPSFPLSVALHFGLNITQKANVHEMVWRYFFLAPTRFSFLLFTWPLTSSTAWCWLWYISGYFS